MLWLICTVHVSEWWKTAVVMQVYINKFTRCTSLYICSVLDISYFFQQTRQSPKALQILLRYIINEYMYIILVYIFKTLNSKSHIMLYRLCFSSHGIDVLTDTSSLFSLIIHSSIIVISLIRGGFMKVLLVVVYVFMTMLWNSISTFAEFCNKSNDKTLA